ncbi:MAG: ATP-dependent helicase, partial [Myxococcota bacterium]
AGAAGERRPRRFASGDDAALRGEGRDAGGGVAGGDRRKAGRSGRGDLDFGVTEGGSGSKSTSSPASASPQAP